MLEKFDRGNREEIIAEVTQAQQVRQPVYDMIARYETELERMDSIQRSDSQTSLDELKGYVTALLGPAPGNHRQCSHANNMDKPDGIVRRSN